MQGFLDDRGILQRNSVMLFSLVFLCVFASTKAMLLQKTLFPPTVMLETKIIEKNEEYTIIKPRSKMPKEYAKYFSFDKEHRLVVNTPGETSVQFIVAVRNSSELVFEILYTEQLKNCGGLVTIYADKLLPHTKPDNFGGLLLWFYTSSTHARLRGYIQLQSRWTTFFYPQLLRDFEVGDRLICRLKTNSEDRDQRCSILGGEYVQTELFHRHLIPVPLLKPLANETKYKQIILRIRGKLCDSPLLMHNARLVKRVKKT